MEIILTETYKEYRERKLYITETYLNNLTAWLKKHAENPDVIPEITEKMVYNAVNDITDENDISYRYYYNNLNSGYDTYLYEEISSYVNEDIWDVDYDVVDGETEDCVIEVEDYEEE